MRAILSVDDKTGIVPFAQGLSALGVEIFSTGNTMRALQEAGVAVRSIADLTGFPEILGGRVKTLHPAVHGGILARRDDPAHLEELAQHNLAPIDLVACNLYPFARTIARDGVTLAEALEKVDIGGVTLLRAAAKNFSSVTVVPRPEEYDDVLGELQATGFTSPETRRRLAAIAFQITALYDTAIADYLRRDTPDESFPQELTLGLHRLRSLRYGENPHQTAALYGYGALSTPSGLDERLDGQDTSPVGASRPAIATLAGARQIHGPELGYNNLLDLDAALNAAASFTAPTTVIIKHTNPCGLACNDSLVESYRRAHAGDPVSAYGGIVGCNR